MYFSTKFNEIACNLSTYDLNKNDFSKRTIEETPGIISEKENEHIALRTWHSKMKREGYSRRKRIQIKETNT